MERYFLVMYQYLKYGSTAVEFGTAVVSKQGGLNNNQFCEMFKKDNGCQQVSVLFFREMTQQEYDDFTKTT